LRTLEGDSFAGCVHLKVIKQCSTFGGCLDGFIREDFIISRSFVLKL